MNHSNLRENFQAFLPSNKKQLLKSALQNTPQKKVKFECQSFYSPQFSSQLSQNQATLQNLPKLQSKRSIDLFSLDNSYKPFCFEENYKVLEVIDSAKNILKCENKVTKLIQTIKRVTKLQYTKVYDFLINQSNSHKNIVKYYSIEKDSEYYYIIMNYLDTSLYQIKKESKFLLEESTIKNYLHQCLEGLNYLHNNHILHLDINPDNIMISKNQIKIIDFGLSVFFENMDRIQPGDSRYECFEHTDEFQYPDITIDWRKADIFSLGVTFYYLLTGLNIQSLDEFRKKCCQNNFPELDLLSGNYSKDLLDIIKDMLRRENSRRPLASSLLNYDYFNNLF